MAGSSGGGLTADQIQSMMPQPSDDTPQPVQVSGIPGTKFPYARADHTHTTSVQRVRMPVVGTGGLVTWNFATAYAEGIVPSCIAVVEAPSGATQAYTVQLQGTPSNTSVTYKVFGPPTVTVGLLGTAVNVAFPLAPAGTYIHIQAAKPTQ